MSEGFSDQDVVTAATALWREVYGDIEPKLDSGASAWSCVSDARAVLTALSAAGRLLPEGAEKEDPDFELLWFNASAMPVLWGADDLEHARNLASQLPQGTEYLIRQRDSWVGPWSVVEPVAIQARGEEIDHG